MSDRNEAARELALAGKWAEALTEWNSMLARKLALDCGLLANRAVALYMNGQPAFDAAETAVRNCPDEEAIRHNFKMITVME
ncbi:MAG: hypothetical protein JNM27_08425 [Leptospirales bacterium]|nr:hypothetical protein [Leptospirales bacterium]